MKTSTKTELIFACLIALFVFVIYGNSINHGYNFDDEYVILNQKVQQGIKAIPDIFTSRYFTSEDQSYGYRPITKITYAIEYSFFGLNPKISHLVNVLLYATTGVLLFLFLVKNFKTQPKWLWLVGTMLFLSHPLHTEVVNSLKNREEILSFLFGLAGLVFAFEFSKSKKVKYLLMTLLATVLSILAKETGVIFLGFCALYFTLEYSKKMKLISVPQFQVTKINWDFEVTPKQVLLTSIVYVLLFSFLVIKVPFYVEMFFHIILIFIFVIYVPYLHFFRKKVFFKSLKVSLLYLLLIFSLLFHFEKIGIYGYSTLLIIISTFYLIRFVKANFSEIFKSAKFIVKTGLIFAAISGVSFLVFYASYILPNEQLDELKLKLANNQTPLFYTENSWAALKLSGDVFVKYLNMLFYPEKLLFYYGYNTIPIPESLNINLVFFVAFALGLTLVLFFVKQTKSTFIFVFFLLIGVVFFSNLFFEVPGIIGDRLMYVASLGFCGLLALGLYELYKINGKFFKVASITLATSILILYSSKTISRNFDWQNKGTLYSADIKYLENSARANMIYADLLFGQAQEKLVESNLEEAKNMFEASAFYYEKSLKVDSSNFTAYNNLGTIYFSFLDKPKKAKSFLKQGLSKRLVNYYAYNNLGMIYEELQKPDSASMYFKKSIDLNPTNIEATFGMARVLHQQNKFEEAFTYYVKVLEKNPREIEAHEKMGDLLLQMNDTSNAIRFYQNVLKINSSRIDVKQKLEKLSF